MAAWRTSSHSAGGNCVEAAGAFRRSPYCNGGECVEVAADDRVMVRDSKNPGPVLAFTRAQWTAFTTALRRT